MKKFLLYFFLIITLLVTVTFFFEYFEVQGKDMSPALKEGTATLILKPTIFFRPKFEQGDIVNYKPTDPKYSLFVYVGRIIAVPGDRIQFRNGEIYFEFEKEGKIFKYEENYNQSERKAIYTNLDGQWITLDGYLILRDNRPYQIQDIRQNIIPENNIIGKAILIFK